MAEDLRNERGSEAPAPAPRPPGTPPLQPQPGPTVALERREEPKVIVTPPRRAQPPPHSGRFLIAYLLLGIVLGAAVIGFAVVMSDDDPAPLVWSSWQPPSEGSERIRQIAEHVGQGYRLPSGRQLVAVIPRSPFVMDPPVAAVAVDEQALFGQEQQFKTFPMDDGMMFFLCGAGENCAIGEGQPTIQRHRLLRREALELALYTFRYMDGVDSVVTFLPPRPPANRQEQAEPQLDTAVYFRKDDLKPLVEAPLKRTLQGRPVGENLPSGQAGLVDDLTGPALYRFSFQQSPDGQSAVLLLSPFAQRS